MDYVLFGMGYGATLMLLGWALRTFGPERKYKDNDSRDIESEVAKRRWVRFIQGLGGVVAIAGIAMVLFTFVIMLMNPDDETGSLIAYAVWGFLIVVILVWCWMYVSRFGVVGVWSREEGYGFRGASARRAATSALSGSTARVAPKPRISKPEPVFGPVAESTEPDDDEPEVVPEAPEVEPEIAGVPETIPSEEDPEPTVEPVDTEDDSDPEYDFGDGTDTTVPGDPGGRTRALMRLRERQARTRNSTS